MGWLIAIKFSCGNGLLPFKSNPTLVECAQYCYQTLNYNSSTLPDFLNVAGMVFVYSNYDSCKAYTSSWMSNQKDKMLRIHHAAFLVLGMAIGLMATITVLVV
jgi:hypothetical protein